MQAVTGGPARRPACSGGDRSAIDERDGSIRARRRRDHRDRRRDGARRWTTSRRAGAPSEPGEKVTVESCATATARPVEVDRAARRAPGRRQRRPTTQRRPRSYDVRVTRVKICGITRLEDAELAVELGAWAVGHDPVAGLAARRAIRRGGRRSAPRCTAAARSPACSSTRTSTRSRATADAIGFTHGPAPRRRGPGVLHRGRAPHRRKVIKAARVATGADIRALRAFRTDFHLLDAAAGALHGGTGETFDWDLLARAPLEGPLILSGGLRPENVAEAIAAARPYAVDVASGVEAAPGVKDPEQGRGASSRPRRPRTARPSRMSRRSSTASAPTAASYVPETLMPALAELEAAWVEARADPGFSAELDAAAARLRRPPDAAVPGRAAVRARRPRRLPQARGPAPHRRAQDQQRARPGAARQADGQAADHRRDRRRPARRRHRDRVRAARPRVRRLHGHRGHAPPAAQRRADGAARRDASSRSRPGARTLKEAVTRRSATGSTNVATTHYIIGSAVGPAPYPALVRDLQRVIGDEARAQVLERAGRLPDARDRLRRRRLQRDRHVRRRSSTTPTSS